MAPIRSAHSEPSYHVTHSHQLIFGLIFAQGPQYITQYLARHGAYCFLGQTQYRHIFTHAITSLLNAPCPPRDKRFGLSATFAKLYVLFTVLFDRTLNGLNLTLVFFVPFLRVVSCPYCFWVL
jgi:hypothetical protein